MKILCDFHHGELYESILKLFEDRLGGKVYRPIGKEWADEGYWNIGTSPDVISQYLGAWFSVETEPGFWIENGNKDPGYYEMVTNVFDRAPHKQVTLAKAKETKWDLIITTMEGHFPPMERFRQKYCPSAKHIFQLGNTITVLPQGVQNVMNSTATDCSSATHVVQYYQEFNPVPLAWKEPINDRKAVYTFLIYNSAHRGGDFLRLEEMMPDWIFKEYGALCRDGNIHKNLEQCTKMTEAAITWLVKMHGDGYGYNLYRSLYAGRPLILNYSTVYKNHHLSKVGFFEEGKNFIDYDGKTVPQLKDAILKMHSNWEECSRLTYNRIRSLVNFDAEESKIRKFLENLI